MYGILFIVFIICAIVILLTDKTSPFYKSSLANGVKLNALSPDNALYRQYKSEKDATKSATLLMTLYNNPEKIGDTIQIYRDNNGQIILVDHKHRLASTSNFFFDSMALNNDSYTYQPAETIYTGATVGGIHTGGTHTNSAHYTKSQYFSGNAMVFLNYSTNLPFFLVSCAQLNENLMNKAQITPVIKDYLEKGGVLTLFGKPNSFLAQAYKDTLFSSNTYSAMELQSRLTSSCGIQMDKCNIIARWLTSMTK